ncbi:MAG: PAS domain-containing protein [Chitinivibrionales bacterium]|nr:PAS domain-containing protein [Chitinivibrionales bacterium]MBD3356859.1 PAS domain-containing protein [Chitinivibrionales bacterium]
MCCSQGARHRVAWELNLISNRPTWSDEIYRILGLMPQEFGATYEDFLDHVYPDDWAVVDEAYTRSIREGRESYEIEHRVIRKNTGENRYVHEKCRHVRDERGAIVRSLGMVRDALSASRRRRRCCAAPKNSSRSIATSNPSLTRSRFEEGKYNVTVGGKVIKAAEGVLV